VFIEFEAVSPDSVIILFTKLLDMGCDIVGVNRDSETKGSAVFRRVLLRKLVKLPGINIHHVLVLKGKGVVRTT
jgi:hypothetical protein